MYSMAFYAYYTIDYDLDSLFPIITCTILCLSISSGSVKLLMWWPSYLLAIVTATCTGYVCYTGRCHMVDMAMF